MSGLPPVANPPFSFRLLSRLTRSIPPIPHASGLSNRIVKPLFLSRHRGERYRITVWDGIEMFVDPADCIGGNLAFVPQLYDAWERAAVNRLLPPGGVFVDVGANIGAYSLWAAKRVGPNGRVLAYEAEPGNFSALTENIRINGFERVVEAHQIGVSDSAADMRLRLNDAGNSGGHSFVAAGDDRPEATVVVPCAPLAALIARAQVERVDFMKLDIEGFEQRVLSRFFADLPVTSPLRPRVILTEMYFGQGTEGDRLLSSTIEAAGYQLHERNGINCLFVEREDRR